MEITNDLYSLIFTGKLMVLLFQMVSFLSLPSLINRSRQLGIPAARVDSSAKMFMNRKILTLALVALVTALVILLFQIKSEVLRGLPVSPASSRQAAPVSPASSRQAEPVPPVSSRQAAPVSSRQAAPVPRASSSNSTPQSRSFTSRVSRPRKKIVYSCRDFGCGGLADRQKGIVGAYILALLLGRDFGILFTTPCDLSLMLGHNKIEWEVVAGEVDRLKMENAVVEYSNLDFGAVLFAKELLVTKDLREKFPSSVSVVTWNMEVVRYLRQHAMAAAVPGLTSASKNVSDIYREALRDLFVLSPALQNIFDTLRASIPPRRKLACAQVRLGSNPGFVDVLQINSITNYPVLSNFLSRYNDSKRFRLFLATDSQQVVEAMRRDFPEVLLTIPGPITHSDKTRGDSACDGFRKAILDEYTLASCDALVISESGLGKVAAFMRGTDKDLFLFTQDKVVPFQRDAKFPNKVGGW